ncbi:hypothetical protein ACWATR_15435 [Nostoc sp. UIC 10890]
MPNPSSIGIRLAFEQAAHSLNIESECVLSSEINTDAQLVYEKTLLKQLQVIFD